MDYLHESAATIYRRRRKHRAVITMTFVTVLLLATVVYAGSNVQGWVGTPAPQAVAKANCQAVAAGQTLTPSEVTINVYNSTARTGLASIVARSMGRQGFSVATVDNDPLGRTIVSLGEMRHGLRGVDNAVLAAAWLPGVAMVRDNRTDASVDLVLGSKFTRLTVPSGQALVKASKRTTVC